MTPSPTRYAAKKDKQTALEDLFKLIPEFEFAARNGDIEVALRLANMYCYSGLGFENSKPMAWAWMLWANEKAFNEIGFDAIDAYADMSRVISQPDKDLGFELYNKIQLPADRLNLYGMKELDRWRMACMPGAQIFPSAKIQAGTRREIIDVGCEGGGCTLYGTEKDNGEWEFYTNNSDWTPTLIDEDAIDCNSPAVNSWEKAVELLDEDCPSWRRLIPIKIDPDFRERIWGIYIEQYIAEKIAREEE